MNDLVAQTRSLPALPQPLQSLLLSDELDDAHRNDPLARRHAVVTAHHRALMPSAIADLRRALEPASKAEIVTALTRLSAHFWNDCSETQWRIRYEDYAVDLGHLPPDLVHEAIRRYRRHGRYWPKVAELLAEVERDLRERRDALRRLERLAETTETLEPTWQPPTPEERARVEELVDRALAELGSARRREPRATGGQARGALRRVAEALEDFTPIERPWAAQPQTPEEA